jgi:hypothetical protein
MIGSKSYKINKGVNRPLEFRGLKAQYIGRLVGAAVGMMGGYAVLRLAGVNGYLGVLMTLGIGGLAVKAIYRISNTYGQYGLMKRRARKRVPEGLVTRSRRIFIQIYSDGIRKRSSAADPGSIGGGYREQKG